MVIHTEVLLNTGPPHKNTYMHTYTTDINRDKRTQSIVHYFIR